MVILIFFYRFHKFTNKVAGELLIVWHRKFFETLSLGFESHRTGSHWEKHSAYPLTVFWGNRGIPFIYIVGKPFITCRQNFIKTVSPLTYRTANFCDYQARWSLRYLARTGPILDS